MKFRTKCNVHYMAYLQSRRVTKLQQEYTWHNSMYLNRPSRSQDIVFIRQILKKNWNQFLLVVKATALKQQISNIYPQIQRTDASDHIYVSHLPVVNVKASLCA